MSGDHYNHAAHEAQMQEIRNALTRIESRIADLTVQVKQTNGRVTALEKWKYGLLVGLGTLAATKLPLLQPILHWMLGGHP